MNDFKRGTKRIGMSQETQIYEMERVLQNNKTRKIPHPIPAYDPDCEYLGKIAFARTGFGSELVEIHLCKNKRCPWVFCETAYKVRECPEQEVMPV